MNDLTDESDQAIFGRAKERILEAGYRVEERDGNFEAFDRDGKFVAKEADPLLLNFQVLIHQTYALPAEYEAARAKFENAED